jgi:hypothetical protein
VAEYPARDEDPHDLARRLQEALGRQLRGEPGAALEADRLYEEAVRRLAPPAPCPLPGKLLP